MTQHEQKIQSHSITAFLWLKEKLPVIVEDFSND